MLAGGRVYGEVYGIYLRNQEYYTAIYCNTKRNNWNYPKYIIIKGENEGLLPLK